MTVKEFLLKTIGLLLAFNEYIFTHTKDFESIVNLDFEEWFEHFMVFLQTYDYDE